MSFKKRRRIGSILGSVVAFTFIVAVMAPGLAQGGRARGHNVRWDLVLLQPSEGHTTGAVVGGTNIGRDEATGDTIELTGSGNAVPARRDATGGGTFVHRLENGEEFARGYYIVTGFVSWDRRTGTFPSFLTDGIGHASQAGAGLLSLNVRVFPSGGSPLDGVLTVHCHFPDTPGPNDEGISLVVGPFNFVQAGGVTVFHVFR
jgi:hypothetical protein